MRNRLKIESAIKNARGEPEIQKEFGFRDAYLWHFVGGEPTQNAWTSLSELPAQTEESVAMSNVVRQHPWLPESEHIDPIRGACNQAISYASPESEGEG